ncbi:MAG: aspartyl-tRNA(Asn)/glutamyl-tRNA(Gln) amidotransferase subunit [Chloroflexota bacterium]|jgi:aspartyl-tRNA(Asn)/glutamyl-tRNA(Gln) amidotransferase subunit A|nr:aspartyl-tRNA(Asn)/glutamyl-tRNA(Gln) amidotransferase subunit [Chloroflexota bacterium]
MSGVHGLDASIAMLAAAMRAGELTSRTLVEDCLARVATHDGDLGAFLRTTPERALAAADAADVAIRAGGGSMLTGIPMAVKDVLCTEGIETTAGSKILQGFLPPYTATTVARAEAAGAVMLGKTNCDEFAMGSSTENSAFGPVHNPWDLGRVPGGSSGGSAVAVAAGEAVFALGSDTGGSIRQPAALTGCVGLKPTYGRTSRYGLIAFASSLDHVGTFTRTVADAAAVLEAIAGYDPMDATSSPRPVARYGEGLDAGVAGLRLGVPREYFIDGMDAGVEAAVRAALDQLQAAGAELVDISLPHTGYGVAVYYIIAPAEASSNLARMDGVRFGLSTPGATSVMEQYLRTRAAGFGTEVKRRIMIGTYALSSGYYDAYYLKAQKVRTLVKQDFDRAFEQCDAIVAATAPTVAFPLGAKTQDPLAMYLNDVLTIPADLAGVPAVSVPCGFSEELPVGLQVIGPDFREDVVLRVAAAYEAMNKWGARRPTALTAA